MLPLLKSLARNMSKNGEKSGSGPSDMRLFAYVNNGYRVDQETASHAIPTGQYVC